MAATAMQAVHPAMQQRPMAAAASPGSRDARAELQRKEQEVSQLRMAALRALEQQLAETHTQHQQLHAQFEELKADFQYNLQLLSERDAELEQADAAAAKAAADLAARASTISQLQTQLAQAQSDVRLERQRAADAAAGFSLKCQQLQQELEQERTAKAAALLQQKEQYEQQKHSIQRLLAEAEEHIQRQRRELSASFLLQVQQVEAKHAAAAADARAEATTAAALAEARAAEAAAAAEQASKHWQRAEAVQTEMREVEAALKVAKSEAQLAHQQLQAQVPHLQQQVLDLQEQLRVVATEKQLQAAELASEITSLKQQLLELQDQATAAAAKQASGHELQLQQLQQRLQATSSKAAAQHAEAVEAAEQLRSQLRALEGQLHLARSERDALQERLAAVVTEAVGAAEQAADEAQQQMLALQQEAACLRATNDALHKTLEEVHAAAASFQEQLVAAGDREQELQRQLLQAQLRLEEHAELIQAQQAASQATSAAADTAARQPAVEPTTAPGCSSSDGHQLAAYADVQALLQQRDAANTALECLEQRLIKQEAELLSLRQQLHQAKAAAMPTAAGGLSAAAAAGKASAQTLPQAQQQQLPVLPLLGLAAGTCVVPSAEASAVSSVDPGLFSALPSPLGRLPPTPGSGSSFWLGSSHLANEDRPLQQAASVAVPSAKQQHSLSSSYAGPAKEFGQPLSASADGAWWAATKAGTVTGVAARAAQLLGGGRHRDTLSTLRSSLEEAHLVLLGSPRAVPAKQQEVEQGGRLPRSTRGLAGAAAGDDGNALLATHQQELAGALVAAEATNERLRAIIAALRQEMEELQAASNEQARPEAGERSDQDQTGVGGGGAAASAVTASCGAAEPPSGSVLPATSTAVQLSLLRAELAASDAELDHVMAHVAILQHRQSSSGTAAAAAQGGLTTELDFLRERVAALLRDNRHYRRQAMQAQLLSSAATAATATAIGAPEADPGFVDTSSSPDQQQLPCLPALLPATKVQLQQGGVGGSLAGPNQSSSSSNNALASVEAAAAAAEAELLRVRDALSEAEQQLSCVSDENEKLMELSNSLRAENEQLKRLQLPADSGSSSNWSSGPEKQQLLWLKPGNNRAAALSWVARAMMMLQQQQQQPVPLPVPVCFQQLQQQLLLPPAAAGLPPNVDDLAGSIDAHAYIQQQQWPTQQPEPPQQIQQEQQRWQTRQQQQQQQQARDPAQPLELQIHVMQSSRPGRGPAAAAAAVPGNPAQAHVVPRAAATAAAPQVVPTPDLDSSSGSKNTLFKSSSAAASVGVASSSAAAVVQDAQASQRPRLAQVQRKKHQQHGTAGGSAAGSSKQVRVRNYNITDDNRAAALTSGAATAVVTAARHSVLSLQQQQQDSG